MSRGRSRETRPSATSHSSLNGMHDPSLQQLRRTGQFPRGVAQNPSSNIESGHASCMSGDKRHEAIALPLQNGQPQHHDIFFSEIPEMRIDETRCVDIQRAFQVTSNKVWMFPETLFR